MTAGVSCSFCVRDELGPTFPAIVWFDFTFIHIMAFLKKLLVFYSSCVVLMQLQGVFVQALPLGDSRTRKMFYGKQKSEFAKVSMKSFQRALYLIPDYRFFHIFNAQVIYFVLTLNPHHKQELVNPKTEYSSSWCAASFKI